VYEKVSRLDRPHHVRERLVRQPRRTDDTIAGPERQEVAAARAARTPPSPAFGHRLAMRRAGRPPAPRSGLGVL
jgi:hypothetical protein